MSIVNFNFKQILVWIFSGVMVASCSNKTLTSFTPQTNRLDSYLQSDNPQIAALFSNETGMPEIFLTQTELNILDDLASQISPEIRYTFDQKYMAWLESWTKPGKHQSDSVLYYALKCNEAAYENLMNFCLQQDDKIFLLFYQIATRANCPSDQYLLFPTHELYGKFPEFGNYWSSVNSSLQREKPGPTDKTCNEATIWCVRKVLETKYGYTYASRLTALFDTRKLLLMTR